MASTPTMIWTALPNGFAAGGIPRLSIYVSLRLDDPTAKDLSAYTLGNWPTALATLIAQQQVRVQLGTATTFTDIPVTIDTSILMPALWTALFPTTTAVTPFEFQDNSVRAIRSYSVGAIHDYIESVYNNVANASATDFPDLLQANDSSNLVNAIGGVMAEVRRLTTVAGVGVKYNPPLPPNLGGTKTGPHPDASLEATMDQKAQAVAAGIPGAEFYRAYRFYNRGQQEQYRSKTVPRVLADIPPPVTAPKFDVHQVIAALGDHPAILKRLGLVIDCTFVRAVPLANFSRIRVAIGDPAGGPQPPNDKTPWTLFEPAGFLPQPNAASDLLAGFLQLGQNALFGVVQSDVDGEALKTIDYAVNMGALVATLKAQKQTNCEPLGSTVPAVPPPPVLQSLPAQRTTGITVYRIDRDQALYGRFQAAASNNTDPGNAVLAADDVVRGYRVDVGHNGQWYSLCARVPSYSIGSISIAPGQDEGYIKAASGTSTSKDPPSGPPVKDLYLHEALFSWHNWSLVVPKPGRSLSIDRDDTTRTQTEVVRRETNPANADFPIEIVTSIAKGTLPPLRFGRSYQLRARAVDLAGNSVPLSARSSPILATPLVTYRRFEPVAPPVLVLRSPLTPGESVEYMVIRSKVGTDPIPDESKIFNATSERHVAPPKTSQFTAELHGSFDALFPDAAKAYAVAIKEKGTWQDPGGDIELIDATGASIDPSPLQNAGAPLPEGTYTIHTSAAPPLPYLPDPIAKGAVLLVPGGYSRIDYTVGSGGWPDVSTLRLVLQAASGTSASFSNTTLFTVSLPRGTITTVRYSSAIADADLPLLARWNAMGVAGQASVTENGGQHWMLTPYRDLTFVHAVEKPMEDPVVDPLTVSRNLGETWVTLSGEIANHSTSTGRLELRAAWTETVDRLTLPKASTEDRTGRIFERDIAYDESKAKIPPPCETVRQEFGDTKHRWVKYHAVATTRYREHFPSLVDSPDLITVVGRETDKINIPNAARPDLPSVLYAVPTFQWTESDDKNTSTRTGRGIRIYVDRTWYSSGDDELLGVILPPQGGNVPDDLKKYVSQWGSDPIWNSSNPSSDMAPDNFVVDPTDPTQTLTIKDGLTLAEVDPGRSDLVVTAVGIQPQYSDDRQLYYFDIVLDAGATYTPFVRLVLARFQPYSLDGAHLSRTVRADFAQLLPDRVATITYRETTVSVAVTGVMAKSIVQAETHEESRQGRPIPFVPGGYNENRDAGRGRLVRAFAERREDPSRGDLGWNTVGSPVYLQPYTSPTAPDTVSFRGDVPLPSTLGDSAEYRLSIEEYEVFETDGDVMEKDLPIDVSGDLAYRSRLVYFDALPLSK